MNDVIYLEKGIMPVWIETKDHYCTTVVSVNEKYVERVQWTDEYIAFEEEIKRRWKKYQDISKLKCPENVWRRTGEYILKSELLFTNLLNPS